MANARWDFPKLGGGQKQGYTNSGIETFKGTELLDNLAREICQNSLDAKDLHSEEPVTVEFKLTTIQKDNYPFLQEYLKYLKSGKKFWQDKNDKKVMQFLEKAERLIEGNDIKILSASDYNTTGLIGSDCGIMESSIWSALVNSDGVSDKSDGSGGSYGIGKNAPFACSDLSLVFYNTYAKDGKKALEGVARAATLMDDKEELTQAIGHYRSDKDFKPITEDIACPIRDKFARDKYGTDIIIVGCNSFIEKNHDWQDKLVQAVLHHFLLAIMEKKLIVKVETEVINDETLPFLIEKYKNANTNSFLTSNFYETLISPEGGVIYKTIINENDLEIYLKSKPEYKRKIAKFRRSGMLVWEHGKRTYQNFTAVVIVRGEQLNEILRKTEPPKHNIWDAKRIEDKEEAKQAQKYIDQIDDEILSSISDIYREEISDSVDSGVGEFLPDDLSNLSEKKPGTDKLKPVIKIVEKPKLQKIYMNENMDIAGTDEGKEVPDDNSVHNSSDSDHRFPEYKPQNKVERDDDSDEDDSEGISPQEGTKKLTTYPNIKYQRITAVSQNAGLYKIILCPTEDCNSLYIEFSAIGEGDSNDKIIVEKYTIDKQTTPCNNTKIGPVVIEKDEAKEIFVTFENKEKMLINMDITEEVEQ
jgi:hypothetical protein